MKRKIELPATMEMRRKVLIQEELTKTEQLICVLANPDTDVAVLEALQEAYNQGYEDARPKWLPIESAPKDGTVVDLVIDGDRWPDCKFKNGEWLYFSEYGDHMYDPEYYPLHKKYTPTHWMPLPNPPQILDK